MIDDLKTQYLAAAEFIKKQCGEFGETAIVSGTGLADIVNELDQKTIIPYKTIPHFPKTTVESHEGNFVVGKYKEKKIVILQGRFHYYEGYEMSDVTFAVRVLNYLGIKNLILTNAAGSVNPKINPGSFLVLKDHINLLPVNPLRGKNVDELGLRFPDMTNVYDESLQELAIDFCQTENISCHSGVYLALQGPSLETPAELLFFNKMGADVVGMSTVPEVIVARHMQMKVIAISVVTNQGYPNPEKKEATIEEVLTTAKNAIPNLNRLLAHLISAI